MKTTLFNAILLIIITLGFSSCKVGSFSESKGIEQNSYIQFIQTQTKYPNGVMVWIDGKNSFQAKIDKETKMGVKGNVYLIPTGRHQVTVKADGLVVYDKEIFTGTKETKQIYLP